MGKKDVVIAIMPLGEDGKLPTEGLRLPSPYRLAKDYALQVYEASGRNMSGAARIMGMHRRSLQRMLALGDQRNG